MRTRVFAAAAAVGVLTLLPAASADAATAKCTARHAETIVATKSGRIFSTPLGDGAARIYGCVYSKNRRYALGIDGDCDPGPTVGHIALIGGYVGYVETSCNIDTSDDSVVVKDLKTGREKWRAIAATGTRADDGEPFTEVTDLAMSSSGSVAWIGEWHAVAGTETPHPNDDRQVRKLDPGAPAGGTLLDSGLSIERRSLGIGSRTSAGYSWVYWTKGSSPVAAKLR